MCDRDGQAQADVVPDGDLALRQERQQSEREIVVCMRLLSILIVTNSFLRDIVKAASLWIENLWCSVNLFFVMRICVD